MQKIYEKSLILVRIIAKILAPFSLIFVFFSVSGVAHAATLYISPSSGSYAIGSTFSVSVFASSADQATNAVSGEIFFPADKLQATSVSKSGSIINLWVQEPSFLNADGTINFEGIILNPGFTGVSGKIITINFKTKMAGSAALFFSSGSILANDGKGTNILTGIGSASFSITISAIASPDAPSAEKNISSPVLPNSKVPLAPEIFSTTHLKQDQWYNNFSPEFSWENNSDIIGVSFYLDNKSFGVPSSISDGLVTTKKYKNLEDGIWYFHLKLKNSFGWGSTSYFKVQIDTVAPKQFEIGFVEGKETENPCPEIMFNTEDQLSGMAYYKVKVGNGSYETIIADLVEDDNLYILPCQEAGKKIIVVEAYDNAGNYTIATEEVTIKSIAPPVFTDYPKETRTDEILIIAGKAAPNAKITIWLQREKDEAKSVLVKSDENGDFTFIVGEKLKEGVYKFWAEMIDSKGAKSGPSEKITIEAVSPYFLRIGNLLFDYLTIVITLLVLLVGLLAIIIYLYYRFRQWRNRIRKETEETKDMTKRAFKALIEEVQEQVVNMDGNSRLSKREKEVSEKLKNSLAVAEGFIEKEIKDRRRSKIKKRDRFLILKE